MERMLHRSEPLRELLRMSWRSLILMAVAGGREFFSTGFLKALEPNSPFRFDFLRRRARRLVGRQGLYDVLIEAFLEAGEEEVERLPSPGAWMEACRDKKAMGPGELAAVLTGRL
jgi:hypothetical protein